MIPRPGPSDDRRRSNTDTIVRLADRERRLFPRDPESQRSFDDRALIDGGLNSSLHELVFCAPVEVDGVTGGPWSSRIDRVLTRVVGNLRSHATDVEFEFFRNGVSIGTLTVDNDVSPTAMAVDDELFEADSSRLTATCTGPGSEGLVVTFEFEPV